MTQQKIPRIYEQRGLIFFSLAKNNVFGYNQSIQNTTTNALSAKNILVCITHCGKTQIFVQKLEFEKKIITLNFRA